MLDTTFHTNTSRTNSVLENLLDSLQIDDSLRKKINFIRGLDTDKGGQEEFAKTISLDIRMAFDSTIKLLLLERSNPESPLQRCDIELPLTKNDLKKIKGAETEKLLLIRHTTMQRVSEGCEAWSGSKDIYNKIDYCLIDKRHQEVISDLCFFSTLIPDRLGLVDGAYRFKSGDFTKIAFLAFC